LDLSATVMKDGFLQSFRSLFGLAPDSARGSLAVDGRKLVRVANRFSGAGVSKPYEFGSHVSPLVRVLLEDELHREEVELTADQWQALVTWVDANAPYHDRFFNRRPLDGGPPQRTIEHRVTKR
jgi:hypothetical protein